MELLKMAGEFISSLQLNSIQKKKGELLKQQIEMLEDRLKWFEEKFNRSDAENVTLRAEVEPLRLKVAALATDDAFEFRGPLFFKKGEDRPRCPTCKVFMSNHGSQYECPQCKYFYKEPPGSPVAGGPGYVNLGGRTY